MEDQFCIEYCTQWIQRHNFQKIGLEFPSDPQHAIKVSEIIKSKTGLCPVILEDSNRACGNCCVDERTAKPRNIDGVIHFGRTCLSQALCLPVLYVLTPAIAIDTEAVVGSLSSQNGPQKEADLILFYDVLCLPAIDTVFSRLKETFPNVIMSTLIVPDGADLTYSKSDFSQDFEKKLKLRENGSREIFKINYRQVILPSNKTINNYNIIYLGPDSPSLVSLQMYLSEKRFYHVNPADQKLSLSNFIKVVMGRSRKIELVKEAKTIGILVTLVRGHQEITRKIKDLVRMSNKRSYSFFMGKINEAKLANIVGVDVFTYIGCPESSLFDRNENTYLYKNIVTPWELEVALNPSVSWSLQFNTDFREFIEDKYDLEVPEEKVEESNNVNVRNEFPDLAVLPRDPGTLFQLHENAAGEALRDMAWQGLDPEAKGAMPLGTVVEGKRGIALGYESEPKI